MCGAVVTLGSSELLIVNIWTAENGFEDELERFNQEQNTSQKSFNWELKQNAEL